jgi:hypothetical protein
MVSSPPKEWADDHRLSIEAADDRLLVVGDLPDPLASEHLRVLPGLGNRLGIVRPAGCHAHVAGFFE